MSQVTSAIWLLDVTTCAGNSHSPRTPLRKDALIDGAGRDALRKDALNSAAAPCHCFTRPHIPACHPAFPAIGRRTRCPLPPSPSMSTALVSSLRRHGACTRHDRVGGAESIKDCAARERARRFGASHRVPRPTIQPVGREASQVERHPRWAACDVWPYRSPHAVRGGGGASTRLGRGQAEIRGSQASTEKAAVPGGRRVRWSAISDGAFA